LLEGYELDQRLHCVDDIEHQIDGLKHWAEACWLVVPGERQADGVENDAEENEVVENLGGGYLEAEVNKLVAGGGEDDVGLIVVDSYQDITPIHLGLG